MILFSQMAIVHEIGTLYIAYMEERKPFLTVEFYYTDSEEWQESALSGRFTFESLLKWLELYYPYHEIYHVDSY